MSYKALRRYLLAITAILAIGASTLASAADLTGITPSAKTLTITINGTLGPVLSGSDPLGLNGQNGMLTLMASEKLSPKKHTSNSATYILPAGAVVVTVGNNQFQTSSPSTLVITLGSSADVLTLSAPGPDGLKVVGTADLKSGSWGNAILKHPGLFKPSPQDLAPAKNSNGPGSKVKYTIFGSSTVLGLKGTISCKD